MKVTKLYLNEKLLLEAFSPSMPVWLQNYVMYNPEYFKTNYGNNHLKTRSKFANTDYHAFARTRDTGRDKYKVAATVLNGGNSTVGPGMVDFSRANFISQNVPSKVDDPIFSDPNKMCFVHLKSEFDETVWVPGMSSEFERFTFNDGRTLTMKQMNSKLLRDVGKDFCYLDLTDPNNFTKQLKADRVTAKSGSVDRIPKSKLQDYHYQIYRGDIDKSGYKRIPSVERYKDKLAELKAKNLPDRVENARDLIVQAQKDLSRVESMIINNGNLSYSTRSSLNNAHSNLLRAIDTLSSLLSYVQRYQGSIDDERQRTDAINQIMRYIGYIKGYVEDVYSDIKTYMPTTIDWNEFDDSIYTDDEFED